MLLKLCFSTFPHQSLLRFLLYAQKQLGALSDENFNYILYIYLFWKNERANYRLNTLIWVWQYKNLHFHRLPFLLMWENKDKK